MTDVIDVCLIFEKGYGGFWAVSAITEMLSDEGGKWEKESRLLNTGMADESCKNSPNCEDRETAPEKVR